MLIFCIKKYATKVYIIDTRPASISSVRYYYYCSCKRWIDLTTGWQAMAGWLKCLLPGRAGTLDEEGVVGPLLTGAEGAFITRA